MNSIKLAKATRVATALVLLSGATAALGQIQFDDVSSETGMTGFTESWGSSWGDVNGDNWPDLFTQGHRDYPRFYRNTGTGTFEDIAYQMDPGNWIADPFDDKHGATWVDYDNDGDEDLLLSVSATGPAQFLVNENGVFTEHAVDADLDNDESSRQSVWFDFDGDGNLDVAQMHTEGVFLRQRDPDDFGDPLYDFDREFIADLDCPGQLNYGQLMDIDGDGSLEVFCTEEGVFPHRIFDITTIPFTDVTAAVPSQGNVNNTIVADFNNDLLYDIVATRGAIRPSGATLAGEKRIEAWLRKSSSQPPGKGFNFEAGAGGIKVTIDYKDLRPVDPPAVFYLNPQGPTVGDAGPVSVSYNAAESRWEARLDTTETTQAYFQIDTIEPITNLVEVDFDNPETAFRTIHWVNSPTGLERNFSTGLWVPVFCGGAAAGDFDNDMDVDIYFVCRRGAENLPNRIYENQGDGTFVELIGHGGEGPVGAGFSFGVGESAALADYDVDGFLDVYVTNGLLYYPIGVGGPDTMLRNQGNSNHWIEIDLAGTASNRDGVGAKVTVSAGGVTQLREQNGGHTRWTQNHQRIHFGLGSNTTADVTITWPSGTVDNFTAVAADTLYDATEGGSMVPAVLGAPVFTALEPGDECSQPPYDDDYGPVVLLWKNCGTGLWSLRAEGGRYQGEPGAEALYTIGGIAADAPFSQVADQSLSPFGSLDNSIPEQLLFTVGTRFTNSKGFDFSTDGQTTSCIYFDTQEIPNLIVGGSKKKIDYAFDLVTLQECEPPPPECGDPNIDSAADFGVYVWKQCFAPGPDLSWNITVSGGGTSPRSYKGSVASDMVIGATGVNLEANDTLDKNPGDTLVDFNFKVGNSGFDGFEIDVPAGSVTCLGLDILPAGTPVYLGRDRDLTVGNIDLINAGDCLPPAPPNPECGKPAYVPRQNLGVFIWEDCEQPSPGRHWRLRTTGGGITVTSRYKGNLTIPNVEPDPRGYNLESSDTLDTVPGDEIVDFNFVAFFAGADGFNIVIPEAATSACLDLTQLPNGAMPYLGLNNQLMPASFDLLTLEACL